MSLPAFRKTLSVFKPVARTYPKTVEVVIAETSTATNSRCLLLTRDQAELLSGLLVAFLATGESQVYDPEVAPAPVAS